jgi:hypothetical protein
MTMKKAVYIYVALLAISFSSTSCFKIDEKLATKQAAPGDILFQVPDSALPAAPSGQPQLVQPAYDLVGANFSKTGNLDITVTMPTKFTKLTINYVNSTTGAREQKAVLTSVTGSVQWNTYSVSTLGPGNTNPTAGTTIILEFIGSNGDGSVFASRVFAVKVLA